LRERARHRDAAQRSGGGRRAQAGARRVRRADPRERHQGSSRAHDGRGGDARGDHVPARVARGRRAAHGRARGARPGVRAGFRGDGAARGSPAGEPLHLARFRRVQCRARPRGGCAVTGTEVAAVGVVTGWGEGAAALPSDAVRAAAGRRVIAAARPPLVGERFRRATRECLLGVAAVEALLREANLDRDEIRGCETALVYVTAAGYGSANHDFIVAGTAGQDVVAGTARSDVVAGAARTEDSVGGLKQSRRGSVPPTAVATGATLHFPYTAP